jgi:plasmid maintenance system antidote protein VapI
MTPFALRTFMLLRGWTAVELAERVPCTSAYIRLLVRGKRTMSAALSERIRNLPKNAKPVKRKPKDRP